MPPVDPSHAPDAQEHDPTGVRALLAGLPDPGPMPEHLVRQIQTRLEVEREHLAGVAGGHPLSGSADRVVDLADERSRRRPGRTLGLLTAAAAGLAVTTIAFTQLFGSGGAGDSGTMAQYPASSDSSWEAGDDFAADEEAGGAAEGSPDLPGADRAEDDAAGESADAGAGPGVQTSTVPPTVLPDLGTVVLDDYAASVAQASLSTTTADGGLSLTPAQATQCWSGVEAPEAEETFAASARLESGGGAEDEVVVLLARGPGDTGRAWVVPHSCTQQPGVAPVEPAGRAATP